EGIAALLGAGRGIRRGLARAAHLPQAGPRLSAHPNPADRPLDGIVIGASAGGVEVLGRLLPALPATLAAAVFVVLHQPPDRPSVLVDIFRDRCAVKVCEAEDKQPVQAGTVYFAPPNYH